MVLMVDNLLNIVYSLRRKVLNRDLQYFFDCNFDNNNTATNFILMNYGTQSGNRVRLRMLQALADADIRTDGGKTGKCFRVEAGTNKIVQVLDLYGAYPFTDWTTQFSVGGWFKFDSVPITNQRGITKEIVIETTGTFVLLDGSVSGTYASFHYRTNTTSWANGKLIGTTPLQAGVWYHVVATYDGSFVILYVNGVEEARKAETGNLNQNAAYNTYLGCVISGTKVMTGYIDYPFFHNYPLSKKEIAAQMNIGYYGASKEITYSVSCVSKSIRAVYNMSGRVPNKIGIRYNIFNKISANIPLKYDIRRPVGKLTTKYTIRRLINDMYSAYKVFRVKFIIEENGATCSQEDKDWLSNVFAPACEQEWYKMFHEKTCISVDREIHVMTPLNYDWPEGYPKTCMQLVDEAENFLNTGGTDEYDILVLFPMHQDGSGVSTYLLITTIHGLGLAIRWPGKLPENWAGVPGSKIATVSTLGNGAWRYWRDDSSKLKSMAWGFIHEVHHRWGDYWGYVQDGVSYYDHHSPTYFPHYSKFLRTDYHSTRGYPWKDNGDGTWTALTPETTDHDTADFTDTDFNADEYFMGLIPKEEVHDMHLLVTDADEADYLPGDTITASDKVITIQDVIDFEGALWDEWAIPGRLNIRYGLITHLVIASEKLRYWMRVYVTNTENIISNITSGVSTIVRLKYNDRNFISKAVKFIYKMRNTLLKTLWIKYALFAIRPLKTLTLKYVNFGPTILHLKRDYEAEPNPGYLWYWQTPADKINLRVTGPNGNYDWYGGNTNFNPFHMSARNISDGTGYRCERPINWLGKEDKIWVKLWASDPVVNQVTMSPSNTSFSFDMGQRFKYMSAFGSATASSFALSMFLFRMDNEGNEVYIPMFDGTSSAHGTDYWSRVNFWDHQPISNTVTASAGDKLCLGVRIYVPATVPVGNIYFGVTFDGQEDSVADSILTVYNTSFVVGSRAESDLSLFYNVYKEWSKILSSSFDLYGMVNGNNTYRYSIQRNPSEFYNIETGSPLRGRRSLRISPDTNFPTASTELISLVDSQQFVQEKWGDKMASLHRYIMISDFENSEVISDVGGMGDLDLNEENYNMLPFPFLDTLYVPGNSVFDISHVTEANPYMTFEYHFSDSVDLSKTTLLSFLGRGSTPTILETYLRDSDGHTSFPQAIFVDKRMGRYETELKPDNVNPVSISSIGFISRYAGDIVMDDIVLLSNDETNRGYDWTRLNMTKYGYNRQGKTNTIRIPYGGGETVQNLGEYNAKGNMEIFSSDGSEILFLNTVENDKSPLYARFKNTGLPIYINSHNVVQRNYVSNSFQSKISINFTEVYD